MPVNGCIHKSLYRFVRCCTIDKAPKLGNSHMKSEGESTSTYGRGMHISFSVLEAPAGIGNNVLYFLL
jgi:hypothetical protein